MTIYFKLSTQDELQTIILGLQCVGFDLKAEQLW